MAAMTLADWAATLLDDCSPESLLLFADWLELDQDDEELAQAARGVRKRLARKGGRPQVLFERTAGCYGWYKAFGRIRPGNSLEVQVFRGLKNFTNGGIYWRWYDFTPETQATAHLTALLDAAQAWARCNPEPLTKGKVTT